MHKYFKDISQAYLKITGHSPEFSIPLPPTASNRQYLRLSSGGKTMIACYNPDRAENEAFMYIRQKLAEAGVRVPEIYYTDLDKHIYLQQDIGDMKLMDLVEGYRKNNNQDYLSWYELVINNMPAIQFKASEDFDFSVCYPREAFDRQSILWDLNYFKYYFLKVMYVPFHEQQLEDDYNRLADFLMEADTSFFLFRDFQSRNIMINEGEVFFIDFQGGRRGALQYDLASLLFEAKAGLTSEERKHLLNYYIEVFSKYSFFNKEKFLKYFPAYCLIRILQAFGAYGYRGYFENKSLFIQSIPPAIENLKWLLKEFEMGVEIPQLRKALSTLVSAYIPETLPESSGKLLVVIHSFSFRKGVPKDFSGNGGGFVFDCRALPNPGRFEEYKAKTGKETEVSKFLDEKQEVQVFVKQTADMVSSSIDNYIERGHEHLMVNFGCTGGQHRSVYCAERLYRYLSEKFDVQISIHHIELERSKDGNLYVHEGKKGKKENMEEDS